MNGPTELQLDMRQSVVAVYNAIMQCLATRDNIISSYIRCIQTSSFIVDTKVSIYYYHLSSFYRASVRQLLFTSEHLTFFSCRQVNAQRCLAHTIVIIFAEWLFCMLGPIRWGIQHTIIIFVNELVCVCVRAVAVVWSRVVCLASWQETWDRTNVIEQAFVLWWTTLWMV